MPTAATRSAAATRPAPKANVDVTAFAGDVREFSRQVVRVARAPLPSGRDAKRLVQSVDDLEKKLRDLRGRFVELVSDNTRRTVTNTPTRTGAAHPAGTRPPLVLDTTEAMVLKGQLVEPVKFQELMGWKSRQAVWKAASDNRVFYMEHQAERYFPAFYADSAYQRTHLEAVTKILGDLPGGSKLQFFLTRKGSLEGKTPLEALAAGGFAKVKNVAAAFAEVSMRA